MNNSTNETYTLDKLFSFDSEGEAKEFTIEAGTKIYIGGMIFTATEDIPVTAVLTEKKIIYIAFKNADNKFEYELDGMKGKANLHGTISYKPEGGTVGLIAQDENDNSLNTAVDLEYKNVALNVKPQADKTLIFAPVVGKDGTLNVTYPNSDYNKMQMAITLDGERVFSGHKIGVDGTLTFNPETKLLGITNGTEVDFWITRTAFEIVAKAVGKNVVAVSVTKNGLTFTPTDDDGTTDFTVKLNGKSLFNVNIDISNGSFSLGDEGRLTFSEGTEIKLDYGDSAITFTVTDSEGGKLSLKNEGFTFTPHSDGGLKVKVLKGGEVPNATFDITGAITYKYTGTIALYKDSIIENVFDNGNKLTVKALSDTTSTIRLSLEHGLTISSEEASKDLNLRLSNDDFDIVNVKSINGTLHYGKGKFTIADGTKLSLTGNVTADVSATGGTATSEFDTEKCLHTANEGATFTIDYLDGTTWELQNGTLKDYYLGTDALSVGSNFKSNDDEAFFNLEEKGTYKLNDIKVRTHSDNITVKLANYDTIITADGISYTTEDENVTLDLSDSGSTISGGKVVVSLAGTDTALEVDTTNGALSYNSTTKTFSFAEGTVIYTQLGDNLLQIVAKNDFSIGVNTDDKISFKLSGAAEVDLINGDRKAAVDFKGELVYESGGKMSLADGTTINIAWDDGNKLKLTSHGSNGSIVFDAERGVKITSDDDNLDMTLTTPYMSTDISHIRGTLYYKDGNVAFDENLKLTATTTLKGQPIFTILETINGTGHISFRDLPKGTIYSADTGAMKITWSRDNLESTFTVNKGSIQIGHNLFIIAEGTDLATDLKNFVPSLKFTTAEAGTYTINGQTIKTSAPDLKMVATDDYMTFNTSGNAVEYDDMNFAGAGNVSLSSDKVVLGAGVEATGFGKDKSFVLAEEGNVTADARIFELDLIDGVPTEISVTGAQNSFIFSRELTKESEAYLDDVLNTDAFDEYTSPYIGKIFAEKFFAAGDNSYRIRTDSTGLQEVNGIAANTTVTGGAVIGDEKTLSVYDIITESEGKFTIGKNAYTISGDSSVAIRARFTEDDKSYASAFKNLNGTVSGDFRDGAFKINGSNSALQIYGDKNIDVVADDSGFEVLGLDAGASLQVSEAGEYMVNSTLLEAGKDAVIVGTEDGSARILGDNIENSTSNTLITGTAYDDTITNTGDNVTIKALGGDDYIANSDANTVNSGTEGSGVSIVAGEGDDTVYNKHSYYPTISGGKGDDSIVVSSGHKTYINGGEGNDSIIGRLKGDDSWAIGGHATVLGGDGDDYISTGYTNDSSIDGGAGNDTIVTYGLNNSINGGEGENIIQFDATNSEDTSNGSYVIFNGYTTVKGFATGFGEGTDTVYFMNDAPACNFLESGLVLYDDDGEDNYARLSFDGVTENTKLNLYYAEGDRHVKEVFINYEKGYTVEAEDFTPDNGVTVETYFVGSTALPNEGIDFNSINAPLNISLDTDYGADVPFWVNNIYSIIGGAGLTTITGSEKSDTIIAGDGDITINAAKADDYISVNSAAALIEYASGDGNDTIFGFNANSTLSISGDSYTSTKSGNDVIVSVGDSEITLVGAANLSTVNIIGKPSTEQLISDLTGVDIDTAEVVALDEDADVDFTNSPGSKVVSLKGGNQHVKFNDEDGNIAIVDEDASSGKKIIFGDGNDLGILQGKHSTTKVTVGSGKDSVIVDDAAQVQIDMSRAEDSRIIPYNGIVMLEGYDASTDSAIVACGVDNIVAAVKDNSIKLGNNELKLNPSARVKLTNSDKNSVVVNLATESGDIQKVGFTNTSGGTLSLESSAENNLLVGNYFDDKSGRSTISAGAGDDTILAGGKDIVGGGDGKNQIYLTPFDQRSGKNYSTVVLSGKGQNTVYGFNAGVDYNSDRVLIDNLDDYKFAFEDDALILSVNDAVLKIDSIDELAEITLTDGSAEVKAVIAKAGQTVAVTNDGDSPNTFIGDKSALDFTEYDDKVNVNLIQKKGSIGRSNVTFDGFNNLRAGDGRSTLIGSEDSDTIIAGNGFNSIWGARGNDILVGKGGSSDKDGSTTFFFLANDGRDTVSDFEFLTQENKNGGLADQISITAADAVTDAICSDNNVILTLNNSDDDKLIIEGAAGKDFKINNLIAKVDKNIAYDGLANCYVASGGSSVNVDSSVKSAEIWLDSSHGVYFLGDIRTLNASDVNGYTELVGNANDNTIIAGHGDSSLWGGNSASNDLLIGGGSHNTFFYCAGNGNDTISGTNDGDDIILADITLEQITGTNITADSVDINFTDGGSLHVAGTSDVTYLLANGSKYSANHETQSW